MKKFTILLSLFAFVTLLNAQNLQLHYDFGKGRQYLTTTVELFKPDKIGSTFFFVDMKSPGIDIKPIKQITGGSSFNEVYFTFYFMHIKLLFINNKVYKFAYSINLKY